MKLKKHHFKTMTETKAKISDKIFFSTDHNLEEPPSRDSFDEESSMHSQTLRRPTLAESTRYNEFKREQRRVRQLSTVVSFATLSKDMPTPT